MCLDLRVSLLAFIILAVSQNEEQQSRMQRHICTSAWFKVICLRYVLLVEEFC